MQAPPWTSYNGRLPVSAITGVWLSARGFYRMDKKASMPVLASDAAIFLPIEQLRDQIAARV